MRTRRRLAPVGFRALVAILVVATGAFATATLVADACPQGCCGVDDGYGNCVLDSQPYHRCDSDGECEERNTNFPKCCYTAGWCGEQCIEG